MNVVKAAENTKTIWAKKLSQRERPAELPEPHRCPDGRYLGHQHWILNEIISGNVTEEKAHRWLGYAQGYLVGDESLTLDDCKYANMLA